MDTADEDLDLLPSPAGGCGCAGAAPLPPGILGDMTASSSMLPGGCACEDAEETLDAPPPDSEWDSFESPSDPPEDFLSESPAEESFDGSPSFEFAPAVSDTYLELLAEVKARLIPIILRRWAPPPGPIDVVSSGGTNQEDFFGDGSDGDVSVSTTVAMTRDMFYNNLTVTGSGRLKTEGYRVFVLKTLLINAGGYISANGAVGVDGSGATAGAGGAGGGGSSVRPFLPRGGDGGAGGTAGGSGTAFGTDALGGTGTSRAKTCAPILLLSGCGGGGGGYAGDASGAVEAVVGNPVLGADGGMGGQGFPPSGSVNLGGGGGGGGGGVVLIFAKNIQNDGRIEANGGDSGQGGSGGGGFAAGGGGGGGGAIYVYFSTYVGTYAGDLHAGGGAGHGTSPTYGQDGTTGYMQVSV